MVTYPYVRFKFAKFVANVYEKHHIKFLILIILRVEPEIALKCIKSLIQHENLKFRKYIDLIMSLIKSLDKYFTQ